MINLVIEIRFVKVALKTWRAPGWCLCSIQANSKTQEGVCTQGRRGQAEANHSRRPL